MNATASPIPFGDYMLKPLSDAAVHSLTMWVRGEFLRGVRASLAGEKSTAEWERTMALAMKTALSIEWLSDEGKLCVLTLRGRSQLLLESLRPTTPGITFDKCFAMFHKKDENGKRVIDHDKLAEFWDAFSIVNDLVEIEETAQKKTVDP